MAYPPTTDPTFLATLKVWLDGNTEVFVLIAYAGAGGAKDFEFHRSFDALLERINGLQSLTLVTSFRQPQLPLRGIVDDPFVASCLRLIPDGTEYLIVETVQQSEGCASWIHDASGESHAELLEHLEDSRGVPVAVGPYPPFWLEGSEDIISAKVPDEHGSTIGGAY